MEIKTSVYLCQVNSRTVRPYDRDREREKTGGGGGGGSIYHNSILVLEP